jgi:hypothetical protein
MNYRLNILTLLAISCFSVIGFTMCCQDSLAQHGWFQDKKQPALSYPKAPMPPAGKIVVPPQESPFFPLRPDGQAFVLDIDSTVNQTDALNRFYYDPSWRGEVWQPYDSYTLAEKGVRLMTTWPQYDAATQSRKFTRIHQWFEKWSGFGP